MSVERENSAGEDDSREGNSGRYYARFGEEEDPADKVGDRWSSRTAFFLVAMGSAVGFGNTWRFPALAADYGGGSFFIPFTIALFCIGLPVLALEIALGQYYQTSVVGVYGTLHRTMRGSGIASVACAFILVSYYNMLLAWTARAFFDTFGSASPWTQPGITGNEAVQYFRNNIIGMDTLGSDLLPTRIVGTNVGYSCFVWFNIYLCLAFGMKWTGRVAYITMGLPIVFLFMFLFRDLTLDGSQDGVYAYIGEWNLSVLSERPDVWSTAVSQIFFSLSVTVGTMPAYGAACPRGEPAFGNAVVVGLANAAFSIVAGFAVFAALGHMARLQFVDVGSFDYSGFQLVFGTWPVVLGTIAGGIHWVRLLFLFMYLVGLDSAFSYIEAPIAVVMNTRPFRHVPKSIVAGVFCVVGFGFSIIYASDAGLIFMGSIDFYTNFIFLLLGFVETFGAGWLYGIETQISSLGAAPVFTYTAANFGSVAVACVLWFGVESGARDGFLALILCYLFGVAMTIWLLARTKEEDRSWDSVLFELTFANVVELSTKLSAVVGPLPLLWAVALKQFIPHVLLVLFCNLAANDQFGTFDGFATWPFQVLGMLCVGLAALIVLVGFCFPQIFDVFDATVDGPIQKIERTWTLLETDEETMKNKKHKSLKEDDDDDDDDLELHNI